MFVTVFSGVTLHEAMEKLMHELGSMTAAPVAQDGAAGRRVVGVTAGLGARAVAAVRFVHRPG
jgi:hypothetical protein